MTSTPEYRRRSIRLPGYDYTSPGAYFVTICTFQRLPFFGDIVNGAMHLNDQGKIAQDCWNVLPAHFAHTELDAFVIMPNHIHCIFWITPMMARQTVGAQHAAPLRFALPSSSAKPQHNMVPHNVVPGSLGAIVRSFKSAATKRINEWHGSSGSRVWQRNYYERVIRDDDELNAVRQYIAGNPANWGEDEHNPENAHWQ